MRAALSRRIIGWARADQRRTERIPHADHGGQETSRAVGPQGQAAGRVTALGTGGDGNAFAVAEWGPFGPRAAPGRAAPPPGRAAARLALVKVIEVWDNRQRPHSTLGDATPTEDEAPAREVATAYYQPIHQTGSSPQTPGAVGRVPRGRRGGGRAGRPGAGADRAARGRPGARGDAGVQGRPALPPAPAPDHGDRSLSPPR